MLPIWKCCQSQWEYPISSIQYPISNVVGDRGKFSQITIDTIGTNVNIVDYSIKRKS